jgi:hypothetical protein
VQSQGLSEKKTQIAAFSISKTRFSTPDIGRGGKVHILFSFYPGNISRFRRLVIGGINRDSKINFSLDREKRLETLPL